MKTHSALITCFDRHYQFQELFNPHTGFYLRTGILEKDTQGDRYIDTGVDPFMRWMPGLLDIGIMGTCTHGSRGLCRQSGVQCYQDGLHTRQENMPFSDFRHIIDQVRGKTFQCALGGRGDPNKHPDFKGILGYCREHDIVPNYTTSGLELTEQEVALTKRYTGAVAVSFYRHPHTLRAIEMFLNQDVKTNIHYVLSSHSIQEAIERLEQQSFPHAVNAIIFLLHKPVGSGTQDDVLQPDEQRLQRFFEIINTKKFPFKIGFDSCSVPGLLNNADTISRMSLDPCEGGRFSCYISPDMKMTPCSFDQTMAYAIDLHEHTIEEAWNSDAFEGFRSILRDACPSCPDQRDCLGGCPLVPEITLCKRKKNS